MSQPPAVENLPTPIAVPLSEHRATRTSLLKLWTGIDVVEMTMRLAAVIGVKWIKERDGFLPVCLAISLRRGLDRPGFGAWRQILEESTAELEHEPPPVFPELGAVWKRATQPLFAARTNEHDIDRSLVELRNHLAHRGATTSRQADDLWSRWEERFLRSFEEIGAFGQVCLVGVHASGTLYRLTGIDPVPVEEEVLPCPVPADGPRDAVYALSSGVCLALWPILAFGPLGHRVEASRNEGEEYNQVYFRRGETRLYYAVLGDSALPMSFQGDEAFSALAALLVAGEPEPPTEFRVSDFHHERQHRHLQRFRGREAFQRELVRYVQEADRPIWITGPAGIGKSASAARLYEDLRAQASGRYVIHYMFMRGDERCCRQQSLRFVGERLAHMLGRQGEYHDSSFELPTVQELALRLCQQGRRLYFILDGMDEVEAFDEEFVDKIALQPHWRAVQWILAGRDQGRLKQRFNQHEVLKQEVQPLAEDEVHAFFVEEIGRLKNPLLESFSQNDLDHLIRRLKTCSKGLPLYMHHVIWDLCSGKLHLSDLPQKLPNGLEPYYKRILDDMGVGRAGQLATSIVSALAVAHEPFSREMLADLLASNELVATAEIDEAMIRLEPVLQSAPAADGVDRFALHHDSFRDYLRNSEAKLGTALTNMRCLIGRAFLVADETETRTLRDYLLRYGIKHLLEIRTLRVNIGREETDSALVALQALEDSERRSRRRVLMDPVSQIDDIRGLEPRLHGSERERLVQVLLAVAADEAKAEQSAIDPEWIHAELIYRETQGLYERFLDMAALQESWLKQGVSERTAQRWRFVFRARRANVRRRKGEIDSAEGELQDCATYFRECSPPDLTELARIEYDQGYVALLRGRIDEAYRLFMASAETAEHGEDPVGAAIGRTVATANGWRYGVIDTETTIRVVREAREEFGRLATDHPSADRWVMNANSHLLQVAAYEGHGALADGLLAQIKNDPWIARTEYTSIVQRATIWRAMAHHQFEKAIELLGTPTTDGSEIANDRREAQARIYFELCYCHAHLAQRGESERYGSLGLHFPADAGNGAYLKRIRELLAKT